MTYVTSFKNKNILRESTFNVNNGNLETVDGNVGLVTKIYCYHSQIAGFFSSSKNSYLLFFSIKCLNKTGLASLITDPQLTSFTTL